MTHNRSSEELEMRVAIEVWGRKRWPEARVIHELKMEPCRVDIAFVTEQDLIGIEIKSSKDTLERLETQVKAFNQYCTQLFVAVAPKWLDELRWKYGVLTVDEGKVTDYTYSIGRTSGRPRNWRCYTTMIDILWAEEARRICRWHSLDCGTRSPLGHMLPQIASKLTGDQIVAGVCRELRRRPTAHQADAPIFPGSGSKSLPPVANLI